ncbi:MAG: hypothetical protein MSC47_06365 [Oscillibacter sp.]|nr:hypothetical protein [Oscillibacter sp.]
MEKRVVVHCAGGNGYAYQYEDSDFEIGDTVILTVKRFDSNKRQMYGKILSKW